MKILLVDDHALFRTGLRLMLERMDASFELLEAGDCRSAFDRLDATPELGMVLLDMQLPDMPGLEALSLMRSRYPAVPVVVISAADDRPTVLEAINRGAMAFIPKSSDAEQLENALRVVRTKGVYIPASALANPLDAGESAVKATLGKKSDSLRTMGMSDREIQVLELLVQGLPNKLIARQLNVSEPTVKAHVAAALRILNVRNRTQAVLAIGRLKYAFS